MMYSFVDRPVASLCNVGRFLLWAMRLWVHAAERGRCPPQMLHRGCGPRASGPRGSPQSLLSWAEAAIEAGGWACAPLLLGVAEHAEKAAERGPVERRFLFHLGDFSRSSCS